MRNKYYDYSGYGVYYITICTKDKKKYFGKLVPVYDEKTQLLTGAELKKTAAAEMVESSWNKISEIYPFVENDCFTIMPDHIHGILVYKDKEYYGYNNVRSLSEIISAFKSVTTRQFHSIYNFKEPLWQRNFYDTIIINEQQYLSTVDYIDNNRINRFLNNSSLKENN